MSKTIGEILNMDLLGDKAYVLSVIGCGGKTTFVNTLANECKNYKVLVTPSTKIANITYKNVIFKTDLDSIRSHKAIIGVQCLGILNTTLGKITAMPLEDLEDIIGDYSLTIIEADGSAGRPCKGWKDTEPVIYNNTTYTIGIVTLQALDKAVSDETVFRKEEFKKLTGLQENDIITQKDLIKMVCSKDGMFKNAVGEKSLLVSKIETREDEEKANSFIKIINENYKDMFTHIAYGSAINNCWTKIKD